MGLENFSMAGLSFFFGMPAAVPIGLGAWSYGAMPPARRRPHFIVALAVTCTAGLALWCVLSFIHAPVLRFQVYAGVFLCGATAASVAVGVAAAFLWARGAWSLRILALEAVVVFICTVGFQIAVLAVWAAE